LVFHLLLEGLESKTDLTRLDLDMT
jgi:hypothetical protein